MNTHDIKRYAVSGDIAYPIHEEPEGDYVTYEDHVAAIEADRQANKITGETSDGYHTFNELYAHRVRLFCLLMHAHKNNAWWSRKHHDGSAWEGWVIAGIDTPEGTATYHLPESEIENLPEGIELPIGKEWDGHTSDDVLVRLLSLRQARGEPVAWYLPSIYGYDSIFRDHSTVKSCTGNPWTGWIPLYTAPQPQQQAGEPVAWLCTPDFEGEQFLATTQGAADTLEKDGWSVQPLYDTPQPQQQTSKHVKDRRIDDVVRGLKASVAVGSDGQWVSVRREARDAAINRLQELNSDCAHMYESYVEAAAGPAPHPQQIPEGYKLVKIESVNDLANTHCEGWCKENGGAGKFSDCLGCDILRAMLEAAPEPKEQP
ncbi:hypothetical protein [Pusillimonas minor]|uniref:WDGH domain-containing protein n=1 Tax=Pusillimonas minor TaxID=2697024 RepID=UPI001C8EDB10|nr:hypothetical protein [Pusillimonas minor]